ncbi:MAG: SRPBCC domain-containing protein [Actinobacteria bacterium]|nr:SRPBCC domain-containing protein [Actinomycetota bacterium]
MPEGTGTETLLIERTFQAPPDAVFDAWTNTEVLRRWFHADRDWDTTEAEVDVRVGGVVRLAMRNTDNGEVYGATGEYTEVDPPTRLAFTWSWDDGARDTLIEIDFEPVGEGATRVRFTHSGLPDEPSKVNHEGGWGRCFDNLDEALAEAGAGRAG